MADQPYNREENEMDDEKLLAILINRDFDTFREEFLSLHPYDQAQFFEKSILK